MFKWFRRDKAAADAKTTDEAAQPDVALSDVPHEAVAAPRDLPAAAGFGPANGDGDSTAQSSVLHSEPDAGLVGDRPEAHVSGDIRTPVDAPAISNVEIEARVVVEQISADEGRAPEQAVSAEATAALHPEPARRPMTLRERLAASARALSATIGGLFKRNPKLDDALLEELEMALIQADVGVHASAQLVGDLGARMRKREFADGNALLAALRTSLTGLLSPYAQPLIVARDKKPFVILTVGVNGAGKTTTIGKLAKRYKSEGHSVMLAAGDTFRAAAVEQLKTWGARNDVTVIAQGSGADSASVIFDALQAAKSRGIDVLIADTAGRLHTQGHLMQELAKVKRVLAKLDDSAPDETLLVIDGGTGQNALNQARQFHQAVGLTGIVVTKLDGTAKGGILFALCSEMKLPVRFIGVGEKREDLREFKPREFVDALLPADLG